MLRVREARRDDSATIATFSAAVSAAEGGAPPQMTADAFEWAVFQSTPLFSCWVAELDGAVGHISFYDGSDVQTASKTRWICDLFVDPAARRRGVGRALMHTAITQGALPPRYLQWFVTPENASAQLFYSAIGPRRDGGTAMFLSTDVAFKLGTT